MKKEDLKQIGEVVGAKLEKHLAAVSKDLGRVERALDKKFEKHLAVVLEEIEDVRGSMATRDDISGVAAKDDFVRLEGKIDRVDNALSAFENSERDKRKQLEVRVTRLEEVGV